MKKNRSIWLVSLALGLLTLACYWPTTRHGFVGLDDPTYVYQNPHIQAGLTWGGIAWAFTSSYASNWHPMTWLSHMLDVQLYGLTPGAHHFTNLLLHAVNAVLVFLVLRQMTGAFWRSALVAALFAWHPLHVESVAWAAERKDVLSTLFFLLTLWAYGRYAELGKSEVRSSKSEIQTQNGCDSKPRMDTNGHELRFWISRWYLFALLFFTLGLMSKPMLVTVPCVLLLLDFWPLARLELLPLRWSSVWDRIATNRIVLLEKIPFFALALTASIITYVAQKSGGAVATLGAIPLGARAENALVAYAQYVVKTICPTNLSVFYPLPDHWPRLVVLACGALLALGSVICFRHAERRAYLLVGWCWFVGTLVPTIGLVQVGSQAMADRYMYIPSLGLFIIAAWGAADLVRVSNAWRARTGASIGETPISTQPDCQRVYWLAGATAALVLLACLFGTRTQLAYWHDEESLFRHALEAAPDNYLAYDHLAKVCENSGRKAEAEADYLALLRLKPRYPEGQYNLGTLLMEKGDLEEAARHLTAAIEIRPGFARAHCNLGLTRFRQNRFAEAAEQLARAAELAPQNPDNYLNLGVTLMAMNRAPEAAKAFATALDLKPAAPEAHLLLALALSREQKPQEARAQAQQAHELAVSAGQADVAAKAADLLKVCQAGATSGPAL